MKVGVLRAIVTTLLAGALAAPASGTETLEDAWARALGADRASRRRAATRRRPSSTRLRRGRSAGPRSRSAAATPGSTSRPPSTSRSPGLPITPPPLFGGDDFVTGQAAVTVPLFTGGRITSEDRGGRGPGPWRGRPGGRCASRT
jgi:hypothetical protein